MIVREKMMISKIIGGIPTKEVHSLDELSFNGLNLQTVQLEAEQQSNCQFGAFSFSISLTNM